MQEIQQEDEQHELFQNRTGMESEFLYFALRQGVLL